MEIICLNYKKQQYHVEQQHEIAKATKALHEYCAAAQKISPEYRQQATMACIAAIAEEMSKG
jgi:hypothetical protein